MMTACRVCRVLGSAILAQRPDDLIIGKAVLEDGAAMVEDHRIDLARCRPQDAPDHLPVESEAFGRPRHNQARGLGAIPALGQNSAVADDIDFADREACEDGLAPLNRGPAVDMLSQHARSPELVADVQRVRDVDGENDGSPTLAEPMPMLDNVANQTLGVHPGGKLRFDVIAALNPDAGQIRLNRREDP